MLWQLMLLAACVALTGQTLDPVYLLLVHAADWGHCLICPLPCFFSAGFALLLSMSHRLISLMWLE
jgi:hypothetical protein